VCWGSTGRTGFYTRLAVRCVIALWRSTEHHILCRQPHSQCCVYRSAVTEVMMAVCTVYFILLIILYFLSLFLPGCLRQDTIVLINYRLQDETNHHGEHTSLLSQSQTLDIEFLFPHDQALKLSDQDSFTSLVDNADIYHREIRRSLIYHYISGGLCC